MEGGAHGTVHGCHVAPEAHSRHASAENKANGERNAKSKHNANDEHSAQSERNAKSKHNANDEHSAQSERNANTKRALAWLELPHCD